MKKQWNEQKTYRFCLNRRLPILIADRNKIRLQCWQSYSLEAILFTMPAATWEQGNNLINNNECIALAGAILGCDTMGEHQSSWQTVAEIRNDHPEATICILEYQLTNFEIIPKVANGVAFFRNALNSSQQRAVMKIILDNSPIFKCMSFARKNCLSTRETDVLILGMRGCDSKDVANRLNCSKRTIDTYWQRIFSKTSIRRQRDVIATALLNDGLAHNPVFCPTL